MEMIYSISENYLANRVLNYALRAIYIIICSIMKKIVASKIDRQDIAILETLQRDGRISNRDLAKAVSLSPSPCWRRLKAMEEAGIIKGYTVEIDPVALGLPFAVWIRIRPIPGQLHNVAKILQGLPEIVECDRVTGEDCFIAKAFVQSNEKLEKLIDKVMPYAMTNTSIIQSSPVEKRLPPILDLAGGV